MPFRPWRRINGGRRIRCAGPDRPLKAGSPGQTALSGRDEGCGPLEHERLRAVRLRRRRQPHLAPEARWARPHVCLRCPEPRAREDRAGLGERRAGLQRVPRLRRAGPRDLRALRFRQRPGRHPDLRWLRSPESVEQHAGRASRGRSPGTTRRAATGAGSPIRTAPTSCTSTTPPIGSSTSPRTAPRQRSPRSSTTGRAGATNSIAMRSARSRRTPTTRSGGCGRRPRPPGSPAFSTTGIG